ncbi:MAG: undecaprenyldiphospho-muramoylpentapeptide beta-N-acetylglucosaminyltransferase [Oscillospiraceae bacterium]|nr:undecaprenyldiphospho-muramoylpentapeptide beta-N-acetylglucosaminyltransferase [Oscillospiraceae bacterium]
MLKILISGGGTAGHISPALAIAGKIREHRPDAEILFVGARGRMECELVPKAGYPIRTVDVRGFRRKVTLRNIGRNASAAVHAVTAGIEAGKIIKEFAPDIAVGTGGFVCGPVLRKAAKMGVPVVVHETNNYPGVTVKMLAKHAAAVLLPSEAAKKYFSPDVPMAVTGNPVREAFLHLDRETARAKLGLDSRPMILSYGGSLGAEKINKTMVQVMARSYAAGAFQHVHAAGAAGYEKTAAGMKQMGIPTGGGGIKLLPYIDDMALYMAAADLVICRCGANTLCELAMAGLPAVLIPSPFVAENHQFYNAQAVEQTGAGICIEEKNLSEISLWQALEKIMPPATRQRMGEAARSLAVPDAAERIWREIEKCLMLNA